MQVKLQIKASILLGLFSLILLHQMIPHLHHEHRSKHDHNEIDLAHSHEHNHKDEPVIHKGIFSILLAMHSHAGSGSEIPVIKISTELVTTKELIAENPALKISLHKFVFSKDEVADFIANYQPPPDYFRLYLPHIPLRGPPQLV